MPGKFEEVYGRTHRGGLSQAEAAEVLGVSERTFRRWRDRYEAEGADGLYDRRLAASRRGARRWTRWRGCWSCSTPATGTSRPSTIHENGWPMTPITASSAELQLCLRLMAWKPNGRRRAAPRRDPERKANRRDA